MQKNDREEDRRSFLFGVGVCAAAIFLPKKKLYFPVAENPLITPSSFQIHSMWKDTNRVGSKTAYFWIGGTQGQPVRLYKKLGSPPMHLFDFDEVVRNDSKDREAMAFRGYGKSFDLSIGAPAKGADREWLYLPGNAMRPKPRAEFNEKVFALEKHFHDAT